MENKATLYKKLVTCMQEIGNVTKQGLNRHFNYTYATCEDITDAVRPILVKHNLALIPCVIRHTRTPVPESKLGAITTVEIQFTLACGDTGETISGIVVGEGQDANDKGFYKAYAGALKYFLKMTFLISSGDQYDPEHDGKATIASQPTRPAPQPIPAPAACRRCGKPSKPGKQYCSEACFEGKTPLAPERRPG